MKITSAMIKEIRNVTGLGIMKCKDALLQTNGDIAEALKYLQSVSNIKLSKKSLSAKTSEGIIYIFNDDIKHFIIEFNVQTDFVIRNDDFKSFCKNVILTIQHYNIDNLKDLFSSKMFNSDNTVDIVRNLLINKIGENILITRLSILAGNNIGHYCHNGKIGAIVQLNINNDGLAKDIAMHIVAMRPNFIAVNCIASDIISMHKKIISNEVKKYNKTDFIANKIINGRLNKVLQSFALESQTFVKDSSILVSDILASNNAKVLHFILFKINEDTVDTKIF